MARRMTFWEDRPRGILPPRISEGRVEISLPARSTVGNPVMDWVGVELVEDTVYLVVELEWRARGEFKGVDLNRPGRVHATGSLHLSEEGWRTFGIALASRDDPVRMFEEAWQITWREGFEFADPGRDDVTAEVNVAAAGVFELPKLGKMATEEETDNHKSEGEPGLGGSAAQSEGEQKDRESINPDGTKGNRKEISTGESSGKAGGSRQGTQGTKEGRNKDRTSPGNSEGAVSKKKLTEEEKIDHLRQLVSLSLGQDIMAIVAASRSWKETRDVMMRKYLAAEKMATEADLAAVQRKNFATYNDFLREFTLVALRIPGVTDRIISKYFLRQFSEFDKDKILSAYQQTSKFVNTRDVDFSTVTDLAEKTVVIETLTLLKEGGIIDLTSRTDDKVKKGIESLHERLHGVDNKTERMESALLVMQAQVSRPPLLPQEAVVPPGVANRGFGRRDPANEQCKYCTAIGYYVRACPKLNHDILKRRCTRSLKGELFGPQGERVNWNSPGGMRRAIIMLNGLEITAIEAEPVGEIIWDQRQGRGPQVNFILEKDGRDRVNATTRLGTARRRINRDTVIEEVAGSSKPQAEPEAEEPEKVYGKPREEEPTDKVTAANKKFRYQIPILSLLEIDDTISKLLGTMVSMSFQTMLQASPRLLKGLRQLLTRRRIEIGDNPELPEGEREEEVPQEVANLQRSRGDLEDLEKAFADIRLSLPDREGGEVMRSPPGTRLSFHALPVGKLKIQIGSHHTDALVDGGAEITLIRRDFATITGCTVNKEVTGSIQGAGGEIPCAGCITKCAVKAGVKESIWSFQRMTVMEEMDHDIILKRPWCTNVEMISMHLHDGSYMVDIEHPVTGRGELLRLLGRGGDPPRGKLATWSPSFEDSTRKGAFARMEGMRERVEIMIEEAFNKKEWIKMGLPQKKRRQEDEVLGVMVVEKVSEVELGASLPKRKKVRLDMPEIALEIPDLLQLIKALRYHKVGVDSTALAKFEREVQKGYCLNGKLVFNHEFRGDGGNSGCSFFRRKIPEGSVRKYKPAGKKAKPVSILLETSKEEAMEKEEEVLRVIRERRATKGHRIPDEVADTMKIGIDEFLTEEENRLIKRTCQEFHLAFTFSDHQKGRLDAKLIPPVGIHTVEHECWNDKGSSYEFGIAGEVTGLLRAKMNSFVAEPTTSPYANRWFVFRKPNKTLRWIQDLQKYNAVTIRDVYSLPLADLLAELHAGRSIYSLIDLYSGYDQLLLDVRDRPYTAMHTPVGQLQMQVTPMGFTNAVAEAQRRMLAVAGHMLPEKCEPYNPIKGAQEKDETEVQPGIRRFVWDHLQDIKDLLRRFLVYNITASGPKSILAVPEVIILGFRCGAYGRKPDPAKTDKISQWSTPLRTTTEVRAFLGVVGFWRIFIKNFAKIAEPIRAMIREEETMDWTKEREGVIQRLKDILTSETVALSTPCFNDEVGRPFILETDGGPLVVGGVLIQRDEGGKERPIRFESRTLNSAERRYSQFKKEVLAILHCLKTFQAYIFGRRFILRIHPTNVAGP
ncbi:hypothetical protein CBR_g282 [Chara braunii]|uniref:Peptidase A2 domain-containing protein n=1 Tax=Chara braunii TaxID=69332 RepID=A0A388JQ47_CHABU|nr:hypothetical protein CBR_g282 [Chara braunii]|eukprot:GBG59949.1 hypothetical protein CBR_g282 [Chara braunii]